MLKKKHLFIMGIRGIPAQHGGFETFAERLSLHLVKNGWDVTVYSFWEGVRRIHIPVPGNSTISTVRFDWKATIHSLREDGLFLTLGYNTAIFSLLQRIKGKPNVINMDGIEWRRDKWGIIAKSWFWLNERAGCILGDHLIADHPKIKEHLSTRTKSSRITMIPYGADHVNAASPSAIEGLGLAPNSYSLVIARPEPENSVLEIVRAFSRTTRSHKLVVLGNYTKASPFHQRVLASASDEVIFLGAIYDPLIVDALRFYSKTYIHGHKVGGTNPSLVEAMGAGCAVVARDNQFNRWVAGPEAKYFDSEDECAGVFDELLDDHISLHRMRKASLARFAEEFVWSQILTAYGQLLTAWHPEINPDGESIPASMDTAS
jgi:glycosyltransferase involved in cell wall biosynthesis